MKAHYHLPGLFEFYELYKEFLPLYRKHREYFYDWCDIGSIYGAPADCIWGGGRTGFGEHDPKEVLKLMQEYGISARLTFSNSLLTKEHLSDKKCNELCRIFDIGRDNERSRGFGNGIIIYSDILLDYIKENYPDFYFVSSTTKVLTDFCEFENELNREEFRYVVPDFRLNKSFDKLKALSQHQKEKVEFLCNECCWFGCTDRKKCYETVSRKNLCEKGTAIQVAGKTDSNDDGSVQLIAEDIRRLSPKTKTLFISVNDIIQLCDLYDILLQNRLNDGGILCKVYNKELKEINKILFKVDPNVINELTEKGYEAEMKNIHFAAA